MLSIYCCRCWSLAFSLRRRMPTGLLLLLLMLSIESIAHFSLFVFDFFSPLFFCFASNIYIENVSENSKQMFDIRHTSLRKVRHIEHTRTRSHPKNQAKVRAVTALAFIFSTHISMCGDCGYREFANFGMPSPRRRRLPRVRVQHYFLFNKNDFLFRIGRFVSVPVQYNNNVRQPHILNSATLLYCVFIYLLRSGVVSLFLSSSLPSFFARSNKSFRL